MSMYRAMQNPDTPDLPFAQSTMELATLTRSSSKYQNMSGWTCGTCCADRDKPFAEKRCPPTALCSCQVFDKQPKLTISTKLSRTPLQRQPKISTELLALAGVLLLA